MPTRTRSGQVWLVALTVGTILSLFGAVLGIIRYGELQSQREKDRIEFDAGSCERGNDFRNDVKKIARGSAEREKRIIRLLVGDNPERLTYIENLLKPAYDDFDVLVESIRMSDCEALLKATDNSMGSNGFVPGMPAVEAFATD